METGPGGPSGPSGQYFRPDPGTAPDGPYMPDKVIGGIVMAGYILCCVCLGGAVTAGMGMLGAAGAAGAAGSGGQEAAGGAAALGAVGAFGALAGVFMIIVGLLGAGIGFGIFQSKKWGFTVGMIVFGILCLLNLIGIASNPLQSIIIVAGQGALCYYCYARLNGKQGPPVSA